MKFGIRIISVLLILTLILSGTFISVYALDSKEDDNKMKLTQEMIEMYKKTYLDLSGRITERGYSATSVTGAYPGMFPRDSAIDTMAMTKFGDYESAQKLLNYLITYNQWYGRGFMAHIIDNLQDENYGNDYLGDPSHFLGAQTFYSQTKTDRDLYLLNAPNNKGVQPFSVPYDTVTSIRLNLTKTNNTDKVMVKILTNYRDSSSVVAQTEYTFGENANGWQTITFEEPVKLNTNYMYYLEVQAVDSGRVVWKGTNGSGTFQSINYDKIADGGYRLNTGDVTGFEICMDESKSGSTGDSDPKISEMVTLGGDVYAEQEIPVYDGETITAVTVELGMKTEVDGNVKATLYKQKGSEKLFIDERSVSFSEITADSEITFRFCLPLGDYSKEDGNYLIRLSAEDAPQDSVVWFGTADSDRFNSVYNDGTTHTVNGDLSFTAFRSNITSTCHDSQQVDGNYMVVYAWAQLYNEMFGNGEYDQWFKDSYPLIERLCNYYIKTQDEFNDELNLIYNPCFEHTRNNQYHKGYDLITNVFASQSLYDMSKIAATFGDNDNASFWADMDKKLVEGIKENLICEFDGKTIYAEMLGQMINENGAERFIKGFSWVNLAPIAANWHSTDTEILANTIEKYKKFGTVDYGGYGMLDACIFLKDDDSGLDTSKWVGGLHQHVIGKGWSWQLMFADQKNDYNSVNELINFSLAYRPESGLYTESWIQKQTGVITYSDPGNQEHASWQLYAMGTIYPTLTEKYPLDKGLTTKLLNRAAKISKSDCNEQKWNSLQEAISYTNKTLDNDIILQAEMDFAASELYSAITDAVPFSLGDVDFDGKVTVSDVVELRKLIMNDKCYDQQIGLGDMDTDGKLSVSDVVAIRKLIMQG